MSGVCHIIDLFFLEDTIVKPLIQNVPSVLYLPFVEKAKTNEKNGSKNELEMKV